MDPAEIGYMRIGHFRIGVFDDSFDRLIAQLEGTGVSLMELTRKRLMLGPRDATTGHCQKLYAREAIEGVIVPRGTFRAETVIGRFGRFDAQLVCCDPMAVGDELEDGSTLFQVVGVQPYSEGDNFKYRACDLQELPILR